MKFEHILSDKKIPVIRTFKSSSRPIDIMSVTNTQGNHPDPWICDAMPEGWEERVEPIMPFRIAYSANINYFGTEELEEHLLIDTQKETLENRIQKEIKGRGGELVVIDSLEITLLNPNDYNTKRQSDDAMKGNDQTRTTYINLKIHVAANC